MLTKKSKTSAYILWFFFGFIGIHNFYIGDTKNGILKIGLIVLSIIFSFFGLILTSFIPFLVIFVLWIIDAVKLGKKIDKLNAMLDVVDKHLEEPNTTMKDIVNSACEFTHTTQPIKEIPIDKNEEDINPIIVTEDEENSQKDCEENTNFDIETMQGVPQYIIDVYKKQTENLNQLEAVILKLEISNAKNPKEKTTESLKQKRIELNEARMKLKQRTMEEINRWSKILKG